MGLKTILAGCSVFSKKIEVNNIIFHFFGAKQTMVKIYELTSLQKKLLSNLNCKLTTLEFDIKKEVRDLMHNAEKKISDPNDWLEDYEIECTIAFILKEDDPEFNVDSDNILAKLKEFFCKKYIENNPLADGKNYNEFQNWNHPMKNEHHCWLYHSLYDHAHLNWNDMLRIGSIWIDIKIILQKIINL